MYSATARSRLFPRPVIHRDISRLLVRLPKTGAVVLSGDVVHFKDNWDNRRVPGFNTSKEQSAASMDRVAGILAKEHAQLWINHDNAQSATQKKAPDFYE